MTKIEPIEFETTLIEIKTSTILLLPDDESARLPSRGQVAVRGTINGCEFQAVLEPDGNRGHWMRIDLPLLTAAGVGAGDKVAIKVAIAEDWPEPYVPDDFAAALRTAPRNVEHKWKDITSMARWEWIRWVNETRNPETRAIRIEKTISKLNGAHRRPCCFNLSACTDPELSRSGKLIDAT